MGTRKGVEVVTYPFKLQRAGYSYTVRQRVRVPTIGDANALIGHLRTQVRQAKTFGALEVELLRGEKWAIEHVLELTARQASELNQVMIAGAKRVKALQRIAEQKTAPKKRGR